MADFPPTAGFINSLDPANPVDDNKVFGADDWFRFVQEVIKSNQFPKSEDGSSNGWDIALTVKASEVNALDGISSGSTIQEQLDALSAKIDGVEANARPVGTMVPWPVQEPIEGIYLNGDPKGPGYGDWWLCNGSSIDGTVYTALWAIIGNQFGGGSQSDMRLPDLQGRLMVSRSNTESRLTGYRQGTLDTLQGNTGGEESHLQTEGELAPHIHVGGTNINGNQSPGGTAAGNYVNTESAGGNEPFNIQQPTIVVAHYIRVI